MKIRCYQPIFIGLAMFLAGCAGFSAEKSLLVACQGYAGTLTTLASQKAAGKLDMSQIAAVDAVRPALNTICLDGTWTNATTALDVVESAMFTLIQMEQSNE